MVTAVGVVAFAGAGLTGVGYCCVGGPLGRGLMWAAGCALACVTTVVCGYAAGDVFLVKGVPVVEAVTTVTDGDVLDTEVDPVLQALSSPAADNLAAVQNKRRA